MAATACHPYLSFDYFFIQFWFLIFASKINLQKQPPEVFNKKGSNFYERNYNPNNRIQK